VSTAANVTYLLWQSVLVGLEVGTAHFSISLDAPTAGADVEEPMSLGEHLGHEDDRFGLVEAKLALSAAISRLPYLEREAIRLRVNQDMQQVDIARQMGCSQMQVSRLLRKAVLRLRELTDPDLGLSDPLPRPRLCSKRFQTRTDSVTQQTPAMRRDVW
jgi:RNA polymerase sigma-B factor